MMLYSISETNENRRRGRSGVKYPGEDDPRFVDGMMFPRLDATFSISPGQSIFTIGSCFARNIERLLGGYVVPTLDLRLADDDPLRRRGATVLNEYNPGSMAQRILGAVDGSAGGTGDDRGILAEAGGHSDFFITGSEPAPWEVVTERRRRIDAVYRRLPGADLLVLTLGMTEAWYDQETGLYLNRAPGAECFRAPAGAARFQLRVLDVGDCVDLLAPALDRAFEAGIGHVLLTVSPVPLQRTFGTDDAVVANAASKATLRCAAQALARLHRKLDYFPSYEMVTAFAGNPFDADNVHVKPEVVARVTRYMLDAYGAGPLASPVTPRGEAAAAAR